VLPDLERYYDAVPRSAARVEEVGPFSLFVGTGQWPYYARPRPGEGAFARADVEAVRSRQRELGVPETFEWVHETTPGLLDVVRSAGLEVLEAPLMVLDHSVWRAPEPPAGMTLRVLDADDPALAAARAVQHVAFGAAGTAAGPEGLRERDAATDEDGLDFTRERLRRGVSVMVVAEGEYGPAATGMHQPVDSVTEVVGVATLPSVRRQGLGGAVTGRLVEDALARGVRTIFLSAGSEDIARVYARLGFRRVGTACVVG
jgi:GNAT superfamily N-acetyltransferase